LAGLVESAERARAALAQSPSVGLNTKSSERG
jgi:hypothetical protein